MKKNCVDKTVDYIENHFDQPITLDELAQAIFVNKFYLSRQFKQAMNISVYQYIKQKRLAHAKQLIISDRPIIDIYLECGFGDYTNFFRAFRQAVGMSPKEYYHLFVSKEAINS
jgi:AraC-like DNA-binding protein